ncbi:MAG: lysyl-tRNA synthetase [Candidatus Beckwithbacteria bacterium GW2011_GWA2_47_25]|nr:MAG: lysyl-tRNA synthetase [Candidatus Beckwithbacteria bacterium GW2011_GWA2_47_25]
MAREEENRVKCVDMASRIDEILAERRRKIEELTRLGIDLYPARSQKDAANGEVVANFPKYEGKSLNLTGRIVSWREHGKLTFGHLYDQSGKIQLFIRAEAIEPTSREKQVLGFGDLKLLDVGDFIQVFGEIVKTKTGEVSVLAATIKLLTKSLRPLPEKWAGIRDPETAFRKRYLDLLMSPEKKERFERKARFWEAKDQDFYLRISTELYEKRLLAGGFEKIYTLGPNFRNEGMDDEHLPEYYQLEWYWAYADYHDGMKFVKEMYRYVAREVYGRTKFTSRGMTYDLADEWEEIDYAKVIKEKLGVDIFSSTDGAMMKVVKAKGLKLGGDINRARLIDNLWKLVRKDIAGPAFLTNEPKFMSPLAKSKPENPEVTERFHVIIAGSEIGNGYSELNNPVDQRARLTEQQKAREEGDEEAQMMDPDFVEMLEYGMPPTCGWGHSERLFWFLEDVSGREGTLFPPLRKLV